MRNAAPRIKAVCNDEPVVIGLDNARTHKGSKADGIDITKTMHELGFFHLLTIPYSPQLNAIEMAFSQLKSHVVSGFIKHPERRKDLGNVIDEAMSKVTTDNINNYYYHQATVVTQCPRGVPVTPDTMKHNEVDCEEENQDEVYKQDTDKLLHDVTKSLGK